MAAPEGNQNGLKLKDLNIRQIAYEQYCAHLAEGNSRRSWCFEHPEFSCTYKTMEKYIKDEVEFPIIKREMAETKGYRTWESLVQETAKGKTNACVPALQMFMRNKYKWDRIDQVHDDDDGTSQVAHEKLLSQLANLQKKD
jgi:hypothetical protein